MPRTLVVLLTFFLASTACAELPSIRLDWIAPLGANAGTTIEVEIAGADIEEVRRLWFDRAGLSAEPVAEKDHFFKITIAADVPPGTYDVRLVGRWGISNPRLFAVSHGLQDVAEAEPNNDLTQAQKIAINSAVGGMADGNGQDLFRFSATAGQRIVIDCQSGVLDSNMDATMSLSAAGKLLASSGDYNGRDPFIDFLVPQDGEYEVLVHDLSYRGGLPYRLLITDHPYVENVFPRAVRAGQPAELTAFGRNFGADAATSQWRINDLPLQQFPFSVSVPGDVLSVGGYQFAEHPNGSITGDQQEMMVTITVQNNTRPGDYALAVLGQAQVPFNKDGAATERPNTLVSLPSHPITIRVKPPTAAE